MGHETQHTRNAKLPFSAFLNFTFAVKQITLMPHHNFLIFRHFFSAIPLRLHVEKSNHNTDTGRRPGPRELHDEWLATEFGSLVAHLTPLVNLQRGEELHICS